ncbi:threonine-phosphate decarboxylase [Chromatium weissei]|nr:threonine-phosphate decarboxylase [Chromatium weissei]
MIDSNSIASPEHGGRLRQAAEQFGIPLTSWLDLSTGINPQSWSVPALPLAVWQRLPEDDDGLENAAARYYGAAENPVPLAGSQAAIQILPTLRPCSRVGVPAIGYQEHAHAWRRAGHQVIELSDDDLLDKSPRPPLLKGEEEKPPLEKGGLGGFETKGILEQLDVLIVINPNNPSGHRWSVATLLDWQQRLAARGGWLIVDEAFMDTTPDDSLIPHLPRSGLIVLRSLGKFFGLAGARVGFLFADKRLRSQVAAQLGPWTVAGASRWVATQALSDTAWQTTARHALPHASARLAKLLRYQRLTPSGETALFQWVQTENAARIHVGLAQQGILVRYFAEPASVRFGLPGNESEWQRLSLALTALVHA